jgi:hypothetical protein
VHCQPLKSERLLGLKKEQRPKRKKTENQFNIAKKGKSFFPVEKTGRKDFVQVEERLARMARKTDTETQSYVGL